MSKINSRPVLLCLPLLLLLLSSLVGPSPVQSAATRTPTRRPTTTLTPTATRTPLTAGLRKQLYYTGLGGGGTEGDCYPELLDSLSSLPGLFYTTWLSVWSRQPVNPDAMIHLCVFGVPFDDGFRLEIYRPDGSLASRADYQVLHAGAGFTELVQKGRGDLSVLGFTVKETPYLVVPVWLPAGLPPGSWSARLEGGGVDFSDTFLVPPAPHQALLSLDRPLAGYFLPQADPLSAPQWPYGAGYIFDCPTRQTGDLLRLYGASAGANAPVIWGLYTDLGDGGFTLVDEGRAIADAKGEWRAERRIKDAERPGVYFWIQLTHPEGNEISTAGPGVCYSLAIWKPCPAGHPSSLWTGDTVKINLLPASLNRLRLKPNRDTQPLARVKVGDRLTITGGPACQGKWVWWQVRTAAGEQGWFPEREIKDLWLVKVNP